MAAAQPEGQRPRLLGQRVFAAYKLVAAPAGRPVDAVGWGLSWAASRAERIQAAVRGSGERPRSAPSGLPVRDTRCAGPGLRGGRWAPRVGGHWGTGHCSPLQTECLNYVRVLQPLGAAALYVCGTNAFQPTCDHLVRPVVSLLGARPRGPERVAAALLCLPRPHVLSARSCARGRRVRGTRGRARGTEVALGDLLGPASGRRLSVTPVSREGVCVFSGHTCAGLSVFPPMSMG